MLFATPTPLAQLLKSETATAHQQLEQRLHPFLMHTPTMASYVAVLQAFHSFFAPLQRLIFLNVTDDVIPQATARRSADLLLEDLKALDETTITEATEKDLPAIKTLPAAIGAMYVLEGSTLGGRMIAKKVEQQLPQLPKTAVQFFYGYKEGTGPMWTSFVKAVNDFSFDEEAKIETVQAANETFLKFDVWIQRNLK